MPSDDNARPLIERLGVAGAQALQRLLKSGDTLAVAWGRTVLAVGEQASATGLQDVTVVQATGGTRRQFRLYAGTLRGRRLPTRSAPG